MIASGSFREDLLYRLNMFHIHLPPLRDRKPDIPDLARYLLARAAKRPLEAVARPADARGAADDDELRLAGQRPRAGERDGVRLDRAGGQPITSEHLPHDVRNPRSGSRDAGYTPPVTRSSPRAAARCRSPMPQTGATRRSRTWRWSTSCRCTRRTNNKQATATELGISLKTLYNKLHKYEEERRKRAG